LKPILDLRFLKAIHASHDPDHVGSYFHDGSNPKRLFGYVTLSFAVVLRTSKVGRKTFAAREDLLDRMNRVAKQRGLSLYSFVNEVFELTLNADELGVDLQGLLKKGELLKVARDAGFILGLENLWYDVAKIAYGKAKRKTLQNGFEAGVWLAKRYLSSDVADPFLAFQNDLEAFTWNASELAIDRVDDEVSTRMICPRFPEAYSFLFASFLEGALTTFGYTISRRDVSRGTIRLLSRREEDNVAKAK